MKHVRKTVLLWYSPVEMYELVTGVQDYPSFLPWCDKAEVLERHEDGITARLGLAYMGVRHAFTTRNWSMGRFRCSTAPGSSIPLAGPAARSGPARSNSTCATPFPARRWKRW